MAGVRFGLVTTATTTGVSKKTFLQIKAPSSQRVLVKKITVSFQSTANNEAPPLVQLCVQTDGTMTALTPVKLNSVDTESIQTVAYQPTNSVEPTSGGNVLDARAIHSQTTDVFDFQLNPLPIPGNTRLGVCVTATTSTTCVVSAECEE